MLPLITCCAPLTLSLFSRYQRGTKKNIYLVCVHCQGPERESSVAAGFHCLDLIPQLMKHNVLCKNIPSHCSLVSSSGLIFFMEKESEPSLQFSPKQREELPSGHF